MSNELKFQREACGPELDQYIKKLEAKNLKLTSDYLKLTRDYSRGYGDLLAEVKFLAAVIAKATPSLVALRALNDHPACMAGMNRPDLCQTCLMDVAIQELEEADTLVMAYCPAQEYCPSQEPAG